MSNSVRPHRRQSTRLRRPWDSPGNNMGVGCHFHLQCMKVKGENEVTQSCLTLSDPTDCSLPGSSVHGIFQARVLEWAAIALSECSFYSFTKQTHTEGGLSSEVLITEGRCLQSSPQSPRSLPFQPPSKFQFFWALTVSSCPCSSKPQPWTVSPCESSVSLCFAVRLCIHCTANTQRALY